MNVTLSSFQGIVPRFSPHTLGNQQASVAHDCKLRNGRLEAWHETCPFSTDKGASMYPHGRRVFTWPQLVEAASVSPDWRCFYITGRTNRLESVYYDCDSAPQYSFVGVPAPTTPPTCSGGGDCDRDTDYRSYIYTYVNQWGEESAPSPPSNVVMVQDGQACTVSGIALPPQGYGITRARIYRAASALRQADGKVQNPVTDYFLCGEIAMPSSSFTDGLRLTGLKWACETQKNRVPPDCLRNICAIEGTVRLAGSVGNRVYFSEFYQPYNWPAKYDLTLDSDIVHMGALDQKIYVTTNTIPYVIDALGCEDMKPVSVLDVQERLPDISCGHGSSAIITPFGLVFSSNVGVILITPKAQWHVLTSQWLSGEEWRRLKPDTARFGYWEGYLFIVTDVVSFLLNINGDPYSDMRGAELVTISDAPWDMKTTNTGMLLMLDADGVKAWNMADELRPFTWVSRELTAGEQGGPGKAPDTTEALGCTWSPASAKIRTPGIEFTLINSFGKESYKRMVAGERPFRLPRIGRHLWFKVKLHGTGPVHFLDMGTSYFTVNGGQ